MARIEQGLYVCTPECAQGAVHEASGCEACHDPDCPHLIDFGTWLTAYCKRCARQMRRDGHRISDKGAPLDDDQLQLDLPA